MKMFTCKFAQDEVTHQRLRSVQKVVQQGRNHFDVRSVCVIREHGKMARTPLAAFFNRPFEEIKVRMKGNRLVLDVLLVALRIGKSRKVLRAQNLSFKTYRKIWGISTGKNRQTDCW